MRYTSDSLVAQRNFPSLYKYNKSFFFSRNLEKKNATGINSPQNAKSSSSFFFFVFFFFVSLCVSLNQARREDERDESLHTKLFFFTKAPEKEQQKEVLTQKKWATIRFVFLPFFLKVCVFLLSLSSSFEERERYFARRQRCAETEDRHYSNSISACWRTQQLRADLYIHTTLLKRTRKKRIIIMGWADV